MHQECNRHSAMIADWSEDSLIEKYHHRFKSMNCHNNIEITSRANIFCDSKCNCRHGPEIIDLFREEDTEILSALVDMEKIFLIYFGKKIWKIVVMLIKVVIESSIRTFITLEKKDSC